MLVATLTWDVASCDIVCESLRQVLGFVLAPFYSVVPQSNLVLALWYDMCTDIKTPDHVRAGVANSGAYRYLLQNA